jgi:cytochrome P450
MRKGDWVVGWLTSANRDPEVFDRPHEFDITRTGPEHITFGGGTHLCLGRNISRIELEILFVKMLRLYPEMRDVGDGRRWNGHNNVVAGLLSFPVALSPSKPAT